MQSETHVLPPSSVYPLFIVAKRYWVPALARHTATDPTAQTLIVLHSTSFHKETWAPTLADLFSLAVQRGGGAPILEAWAIDCPNHGEAGARNRALLRGANGHDFSCERYAQAVHRFLTEARVPFRRRNLVGLGHSLGANAMILLQAIQPTFTFSTLVIIEPMVSAAGPAPLALLRVKLVNRARKRTKCWPTIEEARRDYSHPKRHGARWDPRVLESFVHHALHLDSKTQHLRLSCTREQEEAMYMDEEGPVKPVKVLNDICHRIPVHVVLGGMADLIPQEVHPALIDPSSGRSFASVTIMEDVGHLIPQEKPVALAGHIHSLLCKDVSAPPASRL